MTNNWEDLKRLSEMLEKGEVTREEFDKIKADLISEMESPPEEPAQERPPGWYNDPEGKATHQAYWDGDSWTGETRLGDAVETHSEPVVPKQRAPLYRRPWFAIVGAFVVLAVMFNAFGSDDSSTDNGNGVGSQIGESDDSVVSVRSEMWLDRLEIALGDTESDETRTHLRNSCDEAEVWHTTRADRESEGEDFDAAFQYLDDWTIIAEICNQALSDNDWNGAARRLERARP